MTGGSKDLLARSGTAASVLAMLLVAAGVWDIRGDLEDNLEARFVKQDAKLDERFTNQEEALHEFKSEVRNDLQQMQGDLRANSTAVGSLNAVVSAMEAKLEFLLQERQKGLEVPQNPR